MQVWTNSWCISLKLCSERLHVRLRPVPRLKNSTNFGCYDSFGTQVIQLQLFWVSFINYGCFKYINCKVLNQIQISNSLSYPSPWYFRLSFTSLSVEIDSSHIYVLLAELDHRQCMKYWMLLQGYTLVFMECKNQCVEPLHGVSFPEKWARPSCKEVEVCNVVVLSLGVAARGWWRCWA